MINDFTRYPVDIPTEILGKIRLLSAQRKAQNHDKKTQRAIIVELLEIGLYMLEPTNGSQSTPTETATA